MDPPVQVNAFVWESRPGQLSLTIACALAFRLQHGSEATIVEPLRFYDDEQAGAFDANMRAPFKPRADLLVYGHACAPARGPEVESLLVRVRYAEFAKSLRASGDRVWVRDGTRILASAPRPFRRMQLVYERAARSAENPRGFDLDAAPAERRAAMPNLERASQMQSALLGAVPADAPHRANLLRAGPIAHTATAFVRAVLGGQQPPPPPEGFPFHYFNLAPVDQQLDHLPLGAAITLENLHAEHSLFSSRLPALMPRGFVFDPHTQSHVDVELRCDTLWIDADRESAVIVCRGVVATPYPDAASHVSIRLDPFAREERSNALFETRIGALDHGSGLPFARPQDSGAGSAAPTFGAPPRPSSGADPGQTTRMVALTIGQRRVGPPPRQGEALPFAPSGADAQAFPAGAPGARPSTHPPPAPDRKAFITQEIDLAGPVAATPFEAAPESKVEDPPTRAIPTSSPHRFDEVESDSSTDTPTQPPRVVATPVEAKRPAVRTKKLKPPEIPPTPPPPLPPRDGVAPLATPPASEDKTPPAPLALKPPPRVALASGGSSRLGALKLGNAQLRGAGLMLANAAAAIHGEPKPAPTIEKASDEPRTPGKPASTPPAKPPRATDDEVTVEVAAVIPALARAPVRDEHTDTQASMSIRGVEARTLEEAEAEADRDAFEFPLPKSDGHEVEGVTLEHCAAIRAAIAMPGADRAGVLAKNDLDDATWARVEKAHMARIDQETSKGVMDLLSRYDAAYVNAQDKLRRPIGVKEFARILVARERGDLAEALAEIGVPRSELMRLDRVWKQRRAAYPEVDKALSSAVAALKGGS
ncbi:MAG: DUF2169 domain-containing protein [Polyangiaceae bacterium]